MSNCRTHVHLRQGYSELAPAYFDACGAVQQQSCYTGDQPVLFYSDLPRGYTWIGHTD